MLLATQEEEEDFAAICECKCVLNIRKVHAVPAVSVYVSTEYSSCSSSACCVTVSFCDWSVECDEGGTLLSAGGASVQADSSAGINVYLRDSVQCERFGSGAR